MRGPEQTGDVLDDDLRGAIHAFVYQDRPSWHENNEIKHDDDSVVHETGE